MESSHFTKTKHAPAGATATHYPTNLNDLIKQEFINCARKIASQQNTSKEETKEPGLNHNHSLKQNKSNGNEQNNHLTNQYFDLKQSPSLESGSKTKPLLTKRLKPSGPRPPFPLGGDNFQAKNGPSPILNEQSEISNNIFWEQSELNLNSKQEDTSHSESTNNSTNENGMHSPFQTISEATETNNSSPPSLISSISSIKSENMEQNQSHHNQSNYNEQKKNLFFPEFNQAHSKRDLKNKDKDQAKSLNRKSCKGCNLTYHKLTSCKLCHNCQKTFDAIEGYISGMEGSCRMNKDSNTIELTCKAGHQWSCEFKTKEVKKWCRVCKSSERSRRKEYYQELEKQRLNEIEQLQKRLFEEAKQNKNSSSNNNFENQQYNNSDNNTSNNNDEIANNLNVSNMNSFLSAILEENTDQNSMIGDISIMEYAVNYILQTPEDTLLRLLIELPRDQRHRVQKHLTKMLHPDKNNHVNATQAFQIFYRIIQRRRWQRMKSLLKPIIETAGEVRIGVHA